LVVKKCDRGWERVSDVVHESFKILITGELVVLKVQILQVPKPF